MSIPNRARTVSDIRWCVHSVNHHRVVHAGLVPLTLPRDHFPVHALRGHPSRDAGVASATGKKLVTFTDSTLLTHFGLSGPSCSTSAGTTWRRSTRRQDSSGCELGFRK
jgi:predicted flavoprotein YhiN